MRIYRDELQYFSILLQDEPSYNTYIFTPLVAFNYIKKPAFFSDLFAIVSKISMI